MTPMSRTRAAARTTALAAALAAALALAAAAAAPATAAEPLRLPVLVPLTGFLSLEGTSQRNGAELALREATGSPAVTWQVSDTATSPEVAVNAFARATGAAGVVAVVAPMLGTQMLALLPLADAAGVPLLTVSGTAQITELGSANVFRFFPGDTVVKTAQARYAVEQLGATRPAIVYQTTAYGQSGHAALKQVLAEKGITPVFEEGIDVKVKDMLPVLSKVQAAGADVLLLHLHAGSTALVVRQAHAMGLAAPVVAGSAMHQPSTAALLEPAELKGVCAESGSSPVSGGSAGMERFLERYRAAFASEPDAFALGQYDGVTMALAAIADGARDAASLRGWLATHAWEGLAMTYRSDGKGNMAHAAVILCYDGASRTPRIAARYEAADGAQ